MCGTSCPGRTSIIAGVPPSRHGIYGNRIFVDDGFRFSNPYDVATETLPALAARQGLDVAGIGFGMVRPEDCTLYHGPWWASEMLMGAKHAGCASADRQWKHAAGAFDPDGRLRAPDGGAAVAVVEEGHADRELERGRLEDQRLMDIAAELACSARPPDFILLEIAVTDYYLHKYGVDHPVTDWSLRMADAQIAALVARLERAGMLDHYNLAVTSDHGHADMASALYVDRLLDGSTRWSSEGGVLMVRPETPRRAGEIERRLAEHGVEPWDNGHLPERLRDHILTFVMPDGSDMSFERSRPGTTGVTGPSKYRSNHGRRPGTRSDYRFCLFAGPDIPRLDLADAEATQLAPTLAGILGVDCPWAAPPMF